MPYDSTVMAAPGKGAPPPSDPAAGVYRGRRIARLFDTPEGFRILVGKSSEENDLLSLSLARPDDFWFHLAGDSGSHVVVLNPDRLERLPREVERFAAALAAGYSKARNAGNVAVHVAFARDVSKRRGQPPGEVTLARFRTITVKPARGQEN
jgi:predicted ribosome quality control (RQC) complex YloA/Tae2 family protein